MTPPYFDLHALVQRLSDSTPPGMENGANYALGWKEALISLPLAAVLGAALAWRPVRKGTPARDPAVIQTQIVLACVGAIIMLVVGASLARAFGIVGAASLVRYRAKIAHPKDAAVMLVALAIGLACGVGIYLVAAIATGFSLLVLYILESAEPIPTRKYTLTMKDVDVAKRRKAIESFLRKQRIRFELRSAAAKELSYQVEVPARKRTDTLTRAIVADLGPDDSTEVQWEATKDDS